MTPINDKDQARLSGYSAKARSKRQFTNEDLEQALRDAAKGKENRPLSREAYQSYYDKNPGAPHAYTIIRRYGKWNSALEEAGVKFHARAPYKTKITPEQCIDALLRGRQILDHLPSVGEYQKLWDDQLKEDGHPSGSTIRLKFKTWRAACLKAAESIQ